MSGIRSPRHPLPSEVAVTPNIITYFELTVLTRLCAHDVGIVIRNGCVTMTAST